MSSSSGDPPRFTTDSMFVSFARILLLTALLSQMKSTIMVEHLDRNAKSQTTGC
jgi:hypothetical protein